MDWKLELAKLFVALADLAKEATLAIREERARMNTPRKS